MGQCNVSIERHPPPRRFEARPSSVTRAAAPTQRPPARCPMGYTHIPPEQKRHAYRQRSAGVSYGTIKRNQRIKFGTDALTMSKSSIQRAFKGGRAGNQGNQLQEAGGADAEPLGPAQPEAPEHPLPRQCQPAALAALPSAPAAHRRQGLPLCAVRPDAYPDREGVQPGVSASSSSSPLQPRTRLRARSTRR